MRHYSRRTDEAYVHWIKRLIYFHGKRRPETMGEAEVTAFLNHLAVERHVAAATQNQALSLLFPFSPFHFSGRGRMSSTRPALWVEPFPVAPFLPVAFPLPH